jgi:hypothetical protein
MPRENAHFKKINLTIIDAGHLHEHIKALRFNTDESPDQFSQ